MDLIEPGAEHLGGYLDALRRGWSPDTTRVGKDLDEIDRVTSNPECVLDLMDDRQPAGRTIRLADGTEVPRLPAVTRWMWDGQFAGSINFRWQPGTTDLPPTCLGHIGYGVVPWKRGLGYATRALGDILPMAAAEGLRFVSITTDEGNLASQRVIEANAGVLVHRFLKDSAHGGGPALLFQIDLA